MKTTQFINIDRLAQSVPSISSTLCDYFAEACKVALQRQGHKDSSVLTVEGDEETSFIVKWTSIQKVKGWEEQRDVVENGSIAIAFFLILELTEYEVIEQATQGTGFDYWLGYKEDHEKYDPENFFNARLEVSGIGKGTWSEIRRRVQQKLKQSTRHEFAEFPIFVIVTEFNRPVSIIVKQ